jgi:hypothetical protein
MGTRAVCLCKIEHIGPLIQRGCFVLERVEGCAKPPNDMERYVALRRALPRSLSLALLCTQPFDISVRQICINSARGYVAGAPARPGICDAELQRIPPIRLKGAEQAPFRLSFKLCEQTWESWRVGCHEYRRGQTSGISATSGAGIRERPYVSPRRSRLVTRSNASAPL